MNKGTITTNITNKVATVTFFHPLSNSFTSVLLEQLVSTINSLSTNNKVQVIILQSDGEKAFCAGASFNELTQINNLEEGKKFFLGFANVINAMRKCEKLIIGKIQGKSVGGGVGIIAATDYCFATEAASIKLSELSIGIGPFVISPAVERKIGLSALSELTIDATHWRTAYWAKEKGLFNQVFEKKHEMDDAVFDLAQKLANYNPNALQEIKKSFWENTQHWDVLLIKKAEISGKLVLLDFTKNALSNLKK